METKELLIKYIVPYYIHNLEFQLFWRKDDGSLEYERTGILIELKEKTKHQHPLVFKCRIHETSIGYIDLAYDFSDVKPILLPLSAIIEPMKDGSVPRNEFFILYGGGCAHSKEAKERWKNDFINNILYSPIESINFGVVQKLFEWHFDVYGLIDAGLAIDKRTLKF